MSRTPTLHTALRGNNAHYAADLIQRTFGENLDMAKEFQESVTPAGHRGDIIVYSGKYAILLRHDGGGDFIVREVIVHGMQNPQPADIQRMGVTRFKGQQAILMGGLHVALMEGGL